MSTYINRLLVLLPVLLLAAHPGVELAAQSPGSINYQAVARDLSTGDELADQSIFLQALVRAGGPSGTVVYQESHDGVSTDQFGLFSIQIGAGIPLTGQLDEVNWADSTHWLEIEIDAGSGLESAGTVELVSVPYAFHANTATNVDDADADPDNERITAVSYDEGSNSITVSEGGLDYSADLGPADLDIDPNNERITEVSYSAASNSITISEGGANYSTGLGPSDLDTDPTNELISAVTLTGNILEINEAGETQSVDLTPLTESAIWQYDAEEGFVYNIDDQVGIGTDMPEAKLEVMGSGTVNTSLLAVSSAPDAPVFSVTGESVKTHPGTAFRVEGQEQYSVSLLQNTAVSDYDVGVNDTYIVVQVDEGDPLNINMPAAADHPGRKITVRRTGSVPLPNFASVNINFSDQIDFESGPLVLLGSMRETVVLLSLGEAGWTQIH